MKKVEARVLLKHDTVANWEQIHLRFVPMAGEMIVYDDYEPIYDLDSEGNKVKRMVPDKYGDLKPVYRPGLKIGTGYNYLIDLPFVQITPDLKEKMEF